MNPIVHAELSWLGAQGLRERRDRLLVTLAGISPDLDGLSLLGGTEAYAKWHHVLTHGLVSAVVLTAAFTAFARSRLRTAVACFAAIHLHLLCDLAGSGPGWPIAYLQPFTPKELAWEGQWNLASWQNSLIGLAATVLVLWCAVPFSRTLVELFSLKADAAVVKAVRARFARSKTPS